MHSIKDKRILVTGAGQGIGRQIAVTLAKNGATVLALDINQSQLDSLKSEHPTIVPLQTDLSNWSTTEKAVKTAYPIDALVNNAGICHIEPLTEVTQAHFDQIFNINVKALVNVTKLVAENLLERKRGGSIVNISSQASKAALKDHALYCASKGAVDAFTRAVALELGPKGIRVNCVNPTVVMTALGKAVWSDPQVGEAMLQKIPLGRFAEIEDVVEAVVFLLSDKAGMINGVALPVDGGFLAC